jgi:ligand-binding sensor domain-containing protein
MNNPNDLEYYEGAIWGATEGGIFRFDLTDSSFQLLTQADGIEGSELYCLEIDSSGKLWCSGFGSVVNIYDIESGTLTKITSISNDAIFIRDLVIVGNTVFAAASNGVYEIYYDTTYEDYFIKGGYHQFGQFPVDDECKAVAIYQDELWVGALSGAARTQLATVNKQQASNWETFTTAQGLASVPIVGFAVANETLYTASQSAGYAKFNGTQFQPFYVGQYIMEMRSLPDTIYISCSLGIRRLVNGAWQTIGSGFGYGLSVTKSPDGTLWAGKQNSKYIRGGLNVYIDDQWKSFELNAPAGKYITGLMVDSQSKLWCGGTGNIGKGVYIYDNIDWTNYTVQDSGYNNYFYSYPGGVGAGPQAFLEYPNGDVWVGSFGSGIAVFRAGGEQYYINATEGLYLDSIPRIYGSSSNNNTFPVIGEMLLDSGGNIWLTNRQSNVNKPLLLVPSDFMVEYSPNISWTEFSTTDIADPTVSEQSDVYADRLAMDAQGRLWLSSSFQGAKGVRCFDYNDTPFEKSDDVGHLFTASNGLLNIIVPDIAIDQDNRLWMVTSMGANYYDIPETIPSTTGVQFEILYSLYYIDLNCVTVDPMNNKWFGSENDGVIVLGSDNYTIIAIYNADTDPLLSNRILNITFNPMNGEAFIATSEGLSKVQTPYRAFSQNLGKLEMGPSPFYPGEGELMTFGSQSLTPGASVKIFTYTGILVRNLHFTEASLGWDGRNDKGELVASSIYLVLVVTPEGESLLGKLPVIRR